MGVVEVSLDGGVFDGSVHALDLPVGPGMFRFGAAVFDLVLLAGPGESMDPEEKRGDGVPLFLRESWLRRVVDEVGAVVGKHGVDGVGDGGSQSPEEVSGDTPGGRSWSWA